MDTRRITSSSILQRWARLIRDSDIYCREICGRRGGIIPVDISMTCK
jgi:hypothetical protein